MEPVSITTTFDGYDHPQQDPCHQNFNPALPVHRSSFPLCHDETIRSRHTPIESHDRWVALIYAPDGRIIKRSSASMKPYKSRLLQPIEEDFRNCAVTRGSAKSAGYLQPSIRSAPKSFVKKKRKVPLDSEASDSDSRRESKHQTKLEASNYQVEKWIQHTVSDIRFWEKWFYDAFTAVQQVNCRVIAKEWIKTIHPKKQSTHPYNGKDPRTGVKGDPDATRPHWWPKDVQHREPDHINKPCRIKLLVHIIMQTPIREVSVSGETGGEKDITAQDLKDALDQKKEDRQGELWKKYSIIESITHVRTQLESYQAGGLDEDTQIHAPDFSDVKHANNDEDDDSGAREEIIELADVKTDLFSNPEDGKEDIDMATPFRQDSSQPLPHDQLSDKRCGMLVAESSRAPMPSRSSATGRPSQRKAPRLQLSSTRALEAQMEFDLRQPVHSDHEGHAMHLATRIPAPYQDMRPPVLPEYGAYPWQTIDLRQQIPMATMMGSLPPRIMDAPYMDMPFGGLSIQTPEAMPYIMAGDMPMPMYGGRLIPGGEGTCGSQQHILHTSSNDYRQNMLAYQ